MNDATKKAIWIACISVIVGGIYKNLTDVNVTVNYSKIHNEQIKELQIDVKDLKRELKVMPDYYVTRREFQITIDNLNKTLEKTNIALDKLIVK